MRLPDKIYYLAQSGYVLMPSSFFSLIISDKQDIYNVEKALGKKRIIGIVQPISLGSPELYNIGCVGQIVDFSENDDNVFAITVYGICKFNIIDYDSKLLQVDYKNYLNKKEQEINDSFGKEKAAFIKTFSQYQKTTNINFSLKDFQKNFNEFSINALIMFCPFTPNEKQAMLETSTLQERVRIMVDCMQNANTFQASNSLMLH